jgi:hypothetical protein
LQLIELLEFTLGEELKLKEELTLKENILKSICGESMIVRGSLSLSHSVEASWFCCLNWNEFRGSFESAFMELVLFPLFL